MISAEKKWVISLAVFAAALISVFAIKVKPFLTQGTSLTKDYMEKINTKKRFLARPEGPPTERLVKLTREEGELLRNMYAAGVQKLNLRKHKILPPEILQPSIYWLDTLGRTRRELLAQANKSDVDIPRDLSFGDHIPLEEEVAELLRRLKTVEEIMTLAIKSGMKSVTKIEPGMEEIIQSSGEPFLEKLPLTLSIAGNLESLVRFIHSLQEDDSLYIIEDINIQSAVKGTSARSQSQKLLEADLNLFTTRTPSKSEAKL